ncbi:MAG: hypothetical protein JSS89_04550 [Bacteroidetes bacterium]|nr:hypothetical protein [Bacteroidota bacterium]
MRQHATLDTLSYYGQFETWPSGMTDSRYCCGELYRLSDDTLAWTMAGNVGEVMPTWGVEVYTLSPFAKLEPQLSKFPHFGSVSYSASMAIICGWDSVAYGPVLDSRVLGKGLFKQYQSQIGSMTWYVQYCSGMSHEIVTPTTILQGLKFSDDTAIIAADSTTVYWTTNEGASWNKSPSLGLTGSDTILAAHRYIDGTLEAVIAEEPTTSTIAVLQPGQAVWQRYVVPSNARNPYSNRYSRPVSIVGSTLSSGITSIDSSMYIWDPLMSIHQPTVQPIPTENIVVQRGQAIHVDRTADEVALLDICGRSIGPLRTLSGDMPTDTLEPGTYAMMVGTRYWRAVLIIP